jgi:hypothetical protein
MAGAPGGDVSMTTVTGLVVVELPPASVATAVKLCVPSVRELGVKVQDPEPFRVAGPRLFGPSFTSTETVSGLTDPDKVGVLSFVTPPLEIVCVLPLSVPIVVLIVPLGGGGGGIDTITGSLFAGLFNVVAIGPAVGVKLTVSVCAGG